MDQPPAPLSPGRRLLMVLAIPALLAAAGAWQLSRGAASVVAATQAADDLAGKLPRADAVAAATPNRIIRFSGDPNSYGAALAARMMRDGVASLRRNAILGQVREGLAVAVVAGGTASLVAGMVGLLAAAWAARRSRLSRPALAAAFSRVHAMLPALLATQIAGLAVACCALLLFEVAGLATLSALNGLEMRAAAVGLAVAGFALWLGWLTLRELRRSLSAFDPAPLPVFGREVAQAEAPALWRFIARLAADQGAEAPDHVVAGVSDGFFVTSADVALAPEGRTLRGRTLHLPLPTLAMLAEGETSSVIAHELAHFAGQDDAYSRRFLPIYSGMRRSLHAMGAVNGPSGVRWTQAPAFTLGLHMLQSFDGAVKHWSRAREMEADAASIPAAGAAAAASALVRTILVGRPIGEVLGEAARKPRAAPPDLVAAIVARAEARGLPDPSAVVLEERLAHPTDTHPPTVQRIASLGMAPDAALLSRAARPATAEGAAFARGLFDDWEGMCRAVSADAIAAAAAGAENREAWLRQTAAAAGDGPTELFNDIRRPMLAWAVSLAGFLGVFTLLAYALAFGRLADPSAAPEIEAAAAALLLGAAAAAWRLLAIRRLARTPFLTLHADGFECRGLDRIVPWLAVQRVGVTAQSGASHVFFRLSDATPLPRRVSGWGVRVSRRRRAVTLLGVRPRGLAPQGLLGLIDRCWKAARAAAALAELEGEGQAEPAYVAILTEEQLGDLLAAPAAPDGRA